jgi:TRAP-type C4-dicarboxylate transport system permease large subunit
LGAAAAQRQSRACHRSSVLLHAAWRPGSEARWETTKVNLPFIFALAVVLLLCTYVPALSLFLVGLFYGK